MRNVLDLDQLQECTRGDERNDTIYRHCSHAIHKLSNCAVVGKNTSHLFWQKLHFLYFSCIRESLVIGGNDAATNKERQVTLRLHYECSYTVNGVYHGVLYCTTKYAMVCTRQFTLQPQIRLSDYDILGDGFNSIFLTIF